MNSLRSKRAARLASTFVVLFLLGSSAVFAYATRVPATGVHKAEASAAHPHPASHSHGGRAPSEDSGNRTSSTSNETETSKHSSETTHSENDTETSTGESGSQEHTGNNETTSASEEGQNQSGELQFHFVSAAAHQRGFGEVGVEVDGLILDIQAHVERLNASTQYTLALLVNGTSHALGTMVTSEEGGGEIHAQFNATKPGTYLIGVSLLLGGVLALKSDPSSRTVVLAQSATNTSESGNQQGEHVNTVQGNQEHEQQIKKAEENNSIPAVVQVTGLGATVAVLDSKFSVSVGKLAGNGLAIQITGTNVTGPRVLLVNLSNSASLTTNSLRVTLDGNSITQAASLTQVLNPSPGDPARYIVISTSTGLQLLVSIPHFSTHTIEILPVLAQVVSTLLSVDGSVFLLSLLAVSAVFASVYARRTKIRL
ncbi:MAG: hypothetical protein LYZ69_09585 [Nitrososphaerales archaeon]|nr:hypothetical protein [Nitrososphaerales archaeon]